MFLEPLLCAGDRYIDRSCNIERGNVNFPHKIETTTTSQWPNLSWSWHFIARSLCSGFISLSCSRCLQKGKQCSKIAFLMLFFLGEEVKCLSTPYTHLFQRFSQLLLNQPLLALFSKGVFHAEIHLMSTLWHIVFHPSHMNVRKRIHCRFSDASCRDIIVIKQIHKSTRSPAS